MNRLQNQNLEKLMKSKIMADQKITPKEVFFADQFENLANFYSHYEGTGPEIWEQTEGNLDAFIVAVGPGGTVARVSRYLKKKNPNVKCFLIDPPRSGLFNRVIKGVMYTKEEAEGCRLKNPFDKITEGIGINRFTKNVLMAELDGAYRGTDKEAVEMSRAQCNISNQHEELGVESVWLKRTLYQTSRL